MRSAFDKAYRMAGPFDERRLVGDLTGQRERVAEDLAPECLRRLRQKDRLPRECFADVGSGVSRTRETTGELHRVARLQRRERRARFRRRTDRIRDETRAREGTRGIVNDDHVSTRGDVLKRVRDRILPALAPADDVKRLGRMLEIGGRGIRQIPGQRDDHLVDEGMREERPDTALEYGASGDRQQLFGVRGPESKTASAGRNDC
jgi:hypothetical protein